MVRNDELQSLKGLGEKTQKLLEKTGVHTVTELIHQYPREYVSYAVPVPASQVKEGSLETVETVLRGKVNVSARGGKTIVTAALGEPDQKLEAIWYNTPYLRALLKPRCKYVFRGKTVRKRETLVFEHPEVFTIDEYALVQGRLLPVAQTTAASFRRSTIMLAVVWSPTAPPKCMQTLPTLPVRNGSQPF